MGIIRSAEDVLLNLPRIFSGRLGGHLCSAIKIRFHNANCYRKDACIWGWTLWDKAGVWRVAAVDRVLRSKGEGLDEAARVALHCFAGYLMIDLIELGDDCGKIAGATVLLPRHMEQAVLEDEELRRLLSGRVSVERWCKCLEDEIIGVCEEESEFEEPEALKVEVSRWEMSVELDCVRGHCEKNPVMMLRS